jgi:23S rRNA pseudouridine1911/1915/1917 synthase
LGDRLELKYIVRAEDANKEVKYILKNKLKLSSRLIKKLKASGQIYCNSISVFVNKIVEEGDIVSVNIDFQEINTDITPEKLPLDILYEDNCIIAINKPPNTVVHPSHNHQTGTVANALMFHFLQNGVITKIRPVSRLDRNTSGVIIFAMNQFIQDALVKQMQDNTFVKEYLGIVHGNVKNESGTINLPIERKPGSTMLRHVSATGAPSVTQYEIVESFGNATLLKFKLITGRTHQIRVHSQAIGHPLLGDSLYPFLDTNETNESFNSGENAGLDFQNELIDRQALHSYISRFIHPLNGKLITIKAPLPEDIKQAIHKLRI